MNLRQYIDKHEKRDRTAVRERIADACEVTEPCVRHWANGTRGIPSKHLNTIVKCCDGAVTVAELLAGLAEVA